MEGRTANTLEFLEIFFFTTKTRRFEGQKRRRINGLLSGLLFSGAFFLLNPGGHTQCPVVNSVFGDGEEIRYTISYNWGPVWVDAGIITFSASTEQYRDKTSWHLRATGKTYASYDLLFKVRDYYDTWIDPATFRTFDFKRYTYEGGYTLINTMNFDLVAGKVFSNTKTNNNPVRMDTLPIRLCTFDMLTAIYYTRTLDLSGIPAGSKKLITVLIDDAYYDIYIRAMGNEIVESANGKRYRCNKFAAKMVQGTIFKGDEDVLVWVTDDENKIPVYIEAKIIVGTIKAYLKDYKGLRNQVSSLVR